jgi:predicted nucleotide-binding protein (sugar kinase/HSP70/actin superfamily)
MKITFPHMGRLYIPLKTLFEELGIEVVLPPFNNDKTKNIGCKYSPEYACMPFKLILGNVLNSLAQGADTVIMLGGSGPCRFGYFGHLLNLISRDLGFKFDFICLEPSSLAKDIKNFKRSAGCSYTSLLSSLVVGWEKLEAVDTLEKNCWSSLPRSRDREESMAVFRRAVDSITACRHIPQIKSITSECLNTLNSLAEHSRRLPRAAIVGDIYTLNESYSNQNIEMLLVDRDIEPYRCIYTSDWIKNMLLPWKRKEYYRRAENLSRNYLEEGIGGFALDTVYHAIACANAGFDGIVHIFPITCMPEIVSCQVLRKVSGQKKIPIMSLTVDEHMEKTGLDTRIEAFAELLHSKNNNTG